MKLMKVLSFFLGLCLLVSCSKDDDPSPVEKASISLAGDAQVLEVPSAMAASDDMYAQMATGWVQLANSMSANLSLFQAAAGASKSTNIIVPVNGRVSASGSAVVYTWSDPQFGSIAYQIRDVESKYTFELFVKGTTDTGWYRFLYAEELKDRSAGYMVALDAQGVISSERNAVITRWDWTRSGDNFTFKMTEVEGGFNFVVTVNTKTRAGSLTYFLGVEKEYEIVWDAQGKGTWKEYDGNQLVSEGSWG